MGLISATAEVTAFAPQLAEGMMRVLVEHSHDIQQERSHADAVAATRGEPKRFLLVGGRGGMGTLLGRVLGARGHYLGVDAPEDVTAVERALGS